MLVTAGEALEHAQHAIRVEAAIAKIDVGIDPQLELTGLLRAREVDSGCRQALTVGEVRPGLTT